MASGLVSGVWGNGCALGAEEGELRLSLYFKGARNYVQGGDIFNALVQSFSAKGMWVQALNFKGFTQQCLDLVFVKPEADSLVIAQGVAVSAQGESSSFWLVESGVPVLERREFDERLIIDSAVVAGDTIERVGMAGCSFIEHLIALTKALNYSLVPEVEGKWVFAQLKLKAPLPGSAGVIRVRRRGGVSNKFSINCIEADGVDLGDMNFAVGNP